MDEFSEEFLAHHGIKGQKWGIRRTPEELGHKPKGTKKKSAVKEYINKQKELRAAKKGSAKEEARKLLKEYLRRHPKKLPLYGRALTKDEVQDVIKDIEFDRKLKEIRAKEIEAGWNKVKRISDGIGTLSNFLTNSKNLYNNYVDIYNAFAQSGDNDKPLKRKIGEKKEAPKEDRSAIEKIVSSGTAEQVLSNVSKMTSKELATAMTRLNYEDQLRDRAKTNREKNNVYDSTLYDPDDDD